MVLRAKAGRIVQVSRTCLEANMMEPRKTVLEGALKDLEPENLYERFRGLFIPLILDLRPMLATHNLQLNFTWRTLLLERHRHIPVLL